jgi:hypothetical protein
LSFFFAASAGETASAAAARTVRTILLRIRCLSGGEWPLLSLA